MPPEAVARDLLAALGSAPDAATAAEALAAVAAPRFLGRVGGERHLARLLDVHPAYVPLVGHAGVAFDACERIDDAARLGFAVRDAAGDAAPYLLSMVRREDGWRVTGLVRRELAGA